MRRVVLAAVVLGAIQVALALRWPWLRWVYGAALVIGTAGVLRLWWWMRHYTRTWR